PRRWLGINAYRPGPARAQRRSAGSGTKPAARAEAVSTWPSRSPFFGRRDVSQSEASIERPGFVGCQGGRRTARPTAEKGEIRRLRDGSKSQPRLQQPPREPAARERAKR